MTFAAVHAGVLWIALSVDSGEGTLTVNGTPQLYTGRVLTRELPQDARAVVWSAEGTDGFSAGGTVYADYETVSRTDLRQDVGQRVEGYFRGEFTGAATNATDPTFTVPELESTRAADDVPPDLYVGWWWRFGTTLRRVKSFAGTAFTLTGEDWTSDDLSASPFTGELWRPWGQDETLDATPVRVEQAIRRSRMRLIHDNAHYLITEGRARRYPVPFDTDGIQSVEVSPMWSDQPRWGVPGYWSSSPGMVELATNRWYGEPLEDETLVRIAYRDNPPEFEEQDDWWPVNREWASVEAAYQLLSTLSTAEAEDAGINLAVRGALEMERRTLRRRFLPQQRSIRIG